MWRNTIQFADALTDMPSRRWRNFARRAALPQRPIPQIQRPFEITLTASRTAPADPRIPETPSSNPCSPNIATQLLPTPSGSPWSQLDLVLRRAATDQVQAIGHRLSHP